jgi:predicted small lipoprotein YifL
MSSSIRQFAYPLLLLALTVILTACGGGGGDSTPPANASEVASDTQANKPPEIGRVLTDIRNVANSNSIGGSSIGFAIDAEIIDPDGFDDLSYIGITRGAEKLWWFLLDFSGSEDRRNCRIDNSNSFYCEFYNLNKLHSIELNNWKIVAVDIAGNVSEKPFQFAGFDGETAAGKDIIYSPKYSGNRTSGLPAIESLSFERNGLRAEINEASESFRITFEATDTRIKNYSLELWAFVKDELQGTYDWVDVGYAHHNSTSIKSSPVVVGTQTIIDLSWSDISFRPGFQPTDVVAINVNAFDEFLEVTPDYNWSHQLGVSERISLTQIINLN